MRAKKSPWRPVMPPESLRFELEQSSLLSDDADVAGRATTATTWASSSRGNDCDKFDDDEFDDDDDDNDDNDDDEFFHEIANYSPARQVSLFSFFSTASMARASTVGISHVVARPPPPPPPPALVVPLVAP